MGLINLEVIQWFIYSVLGAIVLLLNYPPLACESGATGRYSDALGERFSEWFLQLPPGWIFVIWVISITCSVLANGFVWVNDSGSNLLLAGVLFILASYLCVALSTMIFLDWTFPRITKKMRSEKKIPNTFESGLDAKWLWVATIITGLAFLFGLVTTILYSIINLLGLIMLGYNIGSLFIFIVYARILYLEDSTQSQ